MIHSPQSPVRLAIIGSGGIAKMHSTAISMVPAARLVAVCSRNIEQARAIADPHQARAFHSPDDLLSAERIDGALIATPSGTHEEHATPFLHSGIHVLCEKPLEISTTRTNRMILAARMSNAILAGFFPLRCGLGVQAIREALNANRFGQLTFISARIKWWREKSYYNSSAWRGTWKLDGGGALMNQGIHAIDLLLWLGGPVARVSAFSATLAHNSLEVEDTLTASLQFENGCLGSISAGTSCYPGLDLSIEISGDAGTAILINDRIEFWQFRDEDEKDEEILKKHGAGDIRGGTSDPKAISASGHRKQIAEFCRAIRGEPANLIYGEEAAAAVATVETIYRSTRSLRAESVQYSK